MCIQEEGKLMMKIGESVHMATQGKNKPQAKQKGKGKYPSRLRKRRSPSVSLLKEGTREEGL